MFRIPLNRREPCTSESHRAVDTAGAAKILFGANRIQRALAAAAPIPKGKEHILLVEDEEQIIRMVRKMLESLGYQITARTSSVEALEAFRTQPEKFDLVFTDLTMPNMTGTELARKLMIIRPDIPIILCTGFGELLTEKKIKAIGIREYVMKPVNIGEMAHTIRRVLDESGDLSG